LGFRRRSNAQSQSRQLFLRGLVGKGFHTFQLIFIHAVFKYAGSPRLMGKSGGCGT
jgi:hypothetical protein